MKRLFLVCLALLIGVLHAIAQDRTITGTVIDRANNEPLPGVTVLLKGTAQGTATGPDGSFSLSAPSGEATLQFRFVGYLPQEQNVGTGNGPVTVSLVTDTKQLGEVVVTALGIEKEKRTLGYSTQTIEAAELTQGRDRSVLNSLQGKVAGVQITNSSGVGSSTRVVIRGNKSLNSNNQPLYVVDGIPISNDAPGTGDNLNNGADAGNRANDINPEDVESVNVLKGPAASALYGSRAANGAIIITTKSGRDAAKRGKKAEITYTSSYVWETILKLPDFQNSYGQGTGLEQADTRENWSWGPKFDGQLRPWGQIVNNQQRYKPYVGLKDNVKEFFDIGSTRTNTLSVAGGDQKSNYILSASNIQQKGVTPGTKYDRTSVKIGGATQLTNKFTTSANLTYTKSGGDLAITGQGDNSVYNQIIQTPRDISLLEQKDLTNPFNTPNGYYGAYTINPYWILANNYYRSDMNRLFGNVQLGYTFNDHFKLNLRAGTDVYTDQRRQFNAKLTAVGQNEPRSTTGSYSEYQLSYAELTTDLIASYFANITEDITVNALVGHNLNQRRRNNIGFTAPSLINNTFQSFNNNGSNIFNYEYSDTDSRSLRRLYGVYGSVDIGFRNYLFLNATARNDWSSTLPKENRSFFYPGVGLSLVVSDLLGLQENKILNYAKLRVNYAQAGNDADPYLIQSIFTGTQLTNGYAGNSLNFPFNGQAGFSVGNRIGNLKLQPEITKSSEVGAELRFFNNRLTIDATYYNAASTQQIFSVPISAASGYTGQVLNSGLIRNKGIELLVSGTPLQIGDFKWDLSVNYTRNRNKVEELYSGVDEFIIPGSPSNVSLIAKVGEPYGTFKAEYFQYSPDGKIVVDANTGEPIKSQPVLRGNINPDYTAGLSSTMSYKGLAVTVVFDTKQGGKFYSRTRDIQSFVGTDPRTLYNDRHPFVVQNSVVQNEDGTYSPNTTPVAVYNYWGQLPAGDNIVDASYTKLREVSLSYSLPSKWLEKTPFGNVSVGAVGRNLFLWTAKENTYVDPESNSFGNGNLQGFDFSSSPSTRTYGANLRVTF